MVEWRSHCPDCQYALGGVDNPLMKFCPRCSFPLKLIEGKYLLQERLGEGGFGSVFKALDLTTTQSKAIKILNRKVLQRYEQADWGEAKKQRKIQRFKQRFRREIQMTSALSQESWFVVNIDGLGDDEDIGLYYVMEYLQGETLAHMLRSWRSLMPFLALPIFDQICAAMSVAHQHAIVHRDLKPENIIVLQQSDAGRFVKVLDFGLAKSFQEEYQDKTTAPIGTPLYMSPEQCLNQDVDQRSDIYALGGILYHLVAGEPPFASFQDSVGLFMAHMQYIPRKPSERAPQAQIPPQLDQVILRALTKSPKDRYQSVEDMWEEARAALALWSRTRPTLLTSGLKTDQHPVLSQTQLNATTDMPHFLAPTLSIPPKSSKTTEESTKITNNPQTAKVLSDSTTESSGDLFPAEGWNSTLRDTDAPGPTHDRVQLSVDTRTVQMDPLSEQQLQQLIAAHQARENPPSRTPDIPKRSAPPPETPVRTDVSDVLLAIHGKIPNAQTIDTATYPRPVHIHTLIQTTDLAHPPKLSPPQPEHERRKKGS